MQRPKKRPTNGIVRTLQFGVAGLTKRNENGPDRQLIIEMHVSAGVCIFLRSEPSNTFDPNAVAVYVGEYLIGYVPAHLSEQLSDYLNPKHEYEARVLDVTGGTNRMQTRGVIVEASFWRKSIKPRKHVGKFTEEDDFVTMPADSEPVTRIVTAQKGAPSFGCLPYILFLTAATAVVYFILYRIAKGR